MDDNESRQLLLDSGVPEDMIDRNALNIASIVGDAVIAVCTKKIAERLVEMEMPVFIREYEAMRYRWRQLGINVE